MRQVFGPGSMPLSRIMGGLVFLGGLALLGGMLWQVGLAGLRASFQALGPWVVPFLLLDSISLLLHTVGWAACFQRHQLRLRLWQLCLVRMAGNAINRVTPTADLGGEVVKVMFLTSALPKAQAVATVLIDKASMALAQMGYLTLGTLYLTGHLPLPVGVQRGVRLWTRLPQHRTGQTPPAQPASGPPGCAPGRLLYGPSVALWAVVAAAFPGLYV